MFEDEAKKTWRQSKILWKEATRYDKIVIFIVLIVVWGFGMFIEATTHMCYDALVAWDQPAEAEEGKVGEEALPTIVPVTTTPSPKPTAAPTPTLTPSMMPPMENSEAATVGESFFSKKIAPQMTSFGERNGDWNYYVDENTGVIYIVYNPMNARYGITPALNADGTPMTRDQLNN